jgi:predicted Zn-dependent protease
MRASLVLLPMLAGLSLPASQGVNVYSREKEAALGRQLAAEFRQRSIPVENPAVRDYVNRLGQRLAAQMPEAGFPFTFSVIAGDPCAATHEPAALPGGSVFVPAALLLAARDEAEFAGVLAHAMEHIAQRHGTRQATRGQIVNYSSIPLIFVGGRCAGQAIPLGFVAMQRQAELEADSLAVQAMARAGFDPEALVRYVERLPATSTGAITKAYSPMPEPDRRIAAMRSAIAKLPRVEYAAGAPGEFAAVQREVRPAAESAPTPPSLIRKRPE